jgi:hypothetical protein
MEISSILIFLCTPQTFASNIFFHSESYDMPRSRSQADSAARGR